MKYKKFYTLIAATALMMGAISSCGEPAGPTATYEDDTAESIYGKISNFSATTVNAGDTLVFTVTPSQYFVIDQVTNNGEDCERVKRNPDGSAVYKATMAAGRNRLKAMYKVDDSIDFVDQFKLTISDDVFDRVVNSTDKGTKTGLDFRRCGIEKVQAPFKWDGNTKKATSAFVNYVDGDTTHIETSNLGYTVKIRYLSIDTPESTDKIEEWGLSASNYNKFVYTGDKNYLKNIVGNGIRDEDLSQNQGGMTTVILMSQAFAKNCDKATVTELNLGSEEKGIYASTTDGNQRDLAYVWYSTAKNPTKDTFRCLNLEMVYQGFSFGTGSMEDTSPYIYKMFDAANLNAEANRRHLHSGVRDLNYHYWSQPGQTPKRLTLDELYASAPSDPDIRYYPESVYADKKTLYKIHGYVSRKVGTSFYMQTKPSYTREEVEQGKALGIYVFTYSQTIINPGCEVDVVGAISTYGGTFQMQGISYTNIDPNYDRDTKIISTGNKVVPVKLTGAEFNSFKLPSVLVEITDNVWFYNFTGTYKGNEQALGEGGTYEVNKYNEFYPFYNISNTPIFYGSFGSTDNAKTLNDATKANRDGVRYDDRVIRFTLDENVLVKYGLEDSKTYQFFGGGSLLYNAKGPEYITQPGEGGTVKFDYVRKAALYDPADEDGHGLIVISTGYESTGGNKKMTGKICSGKRADIILTEVGA